MNPSKFPPFRKKDFRFSKHSRKNISSLISSYLPHIQKKKTITLKCWSLEFYLLPLPLSIISYHFYNTSKKLDQKRRINKELRKKNCKISIFILSWCPLSDGECQNQRLWLDMERKTILVARIYLIYWSVSSGVRSSQPKQPSSLSYRLKSIVISERLSL